MGIVAYIVPFIFVYAPALLLKESAQEIATIVLSSMLGIVFLTVALLPPLSRILLLIGALGLMVPTEAAGAIRVLDKHKCLLYSLAKREDKRKHNYMEAN